MFLFSIKIENRWNGKNTPLESFLVKDFLWLNIICANMRLGSEYQCCSNGEARCTLAIFQVGPNVLGVTTLWLGSGPLLRLCSNPMCTSRICDVYINISLACASAILLLLIVGI
jgi:hypothetical protein